MRTPLVSLTLATVFFVAAYAKADIVTMYSADQKDAYMALALDTEWGLVGSADFEKAKAPFVGEFTLTNLLDKYRSEGDKIGDLKGTYSLLAYDGNGAGYAHTLTGADDYLGMQFSHNSANQATISLSIGVADMVRISSFFIEVGTHANESSTEGTYDISVKTTNGTQIYQAVPYDWAGFILDEGVYLTGFEITQNANNNTGFYFDFVPGNGVAASPEPATLAIFGLGLAGLGLVRARRQNKK